MNFETIQFLYLTTTGWKSSNPHTIEIWFIEHQGRFYLVSEGRDKSHWVQNIMHLPAIVFRIEETTYTGEGRVIEPSVEPTLAQAVAEKMNRKYNWSDGLIVELRPTP